MLYSYFEGFKMLYGSLYKTRLYELEDEKSKNISISTISNIHIDLTRGPFNFYIPLEHIEYHRLSSSKSFSKNVYRINDNGIYLALYQVLGNKKIEDIMKETGFEIAKLCALLECQFSDIIEKKIYEGFIYTDIQNFCFSPQIGSIKIVSKEFPSISEIFNNLSILNDQIESMSEKDKNLFKISSRWYMKGMEAENQIDRFIFWFTVLETYPYDENKNKTNIPKNVIRLISRSIQVDGTEQQLIKRFKLNDMYRIRVKIIHSGNIFFDKKEKEKFDKIMQILEILSLIIVKIQGRIDFEKEYKNLLKITEEIK